MRILISALSLIPSRACVALTPCKNPVVISPGALMDHLHMQIGWFSRSVFLLLAF